jgi:hypothetical protein
MEVKLTQFIRPNGRQEEITAEVDDALRPQVEAIIKAGLRFTAEVIPGGNVSLCIENDEEDLAIEIARNSPGENTPRAALERLISRFKGV